MLVKQTGAKLVYGNRLWSFVHDLWGM